LVLRDGPSSWVFARRRWTLASHLQGLVVGRRADSGCVLVSAGEDAAAAVAVAVGGGGDIDDDLALVCKAPAHDVDAQGPGATTAEAAEEEAAGDEQAAWQLWCEAVREGEKYRVGMSKEERLDGQELEAEGEEGAAVIQAEEQKGSTARTTYAGAWSLGDRVPCCAGRGNSVSGAIYVLAQDSESCLDRLEMAEATS
jgi:hypothetical protein